MPTRRRVKTRKTQRITKRRRTHGGGKEDKRNKNKSIKSNMDMDSLFADLPSIRRKAKLSVKQIAINEEKIKKALEKTTRKTAKSAREAAKHEMDELSDLLGKSGL